MASKRGPGGALARPGRRGSPHDVCTLPLAMNRTSPKSDDHSPAVHRCKRPTVQTGEGLIESLLAVGKWAHGHCHVHGLPPAVFGSGLSAEIEIAMQVTCVLRL